MKKKVLSIALALAFILTLSAGCAGTEPAATEPPAQSAAASAEPSATPSEAPPAETAVPASTEPTAESSPPAEEAAPLYPIFEKTTELSILWMFHIFMSKFGVTSDTVQDVPTFKMAEEATNVRLNFNFVGEESYKERILLMYAAGEYCDLLCNGVQNYSTGADAAVDDGVILNIAPYLEACAPDYNAILQKYPDFRKALTSSAGYVTSFAEYCEYSDSGTVVRKDWLKKVGLEVPETMDEVLEACRAFKSELGATNAVLWNKDCNTFFGWQAYGVAAPGNGILPWSLDNGKVVCACYLDGFKKTLQWMHTCMEEGLTTDDFMGIMGLNFDEFIIGNETGICSNSAATLAESYKVQNADPDYDLRAMPDPVENKGDKIMTTQATGGVGASAISVSALTKYPEECIKYMNWLYTEEGILVSNYGIEGESFNYDENGKPVYTALITDNPDGYSSFIATFLYASFVGTPYFNTTERKNATFTTEAEKECIAIWASNRAGGNVFRAELTKDEQEDYQIIATDASTFVSEQVLQFIMGDRDLSEYDAFLEELSNSFDIDKATELQQTGYDRYQAK